MVAKVWYRPFSSFMVTIVNIISAILVGKTNYYRSWCSMAILKVVYFVENNYNV